MRDVPFPNGLNAGLTLAFFQFAWRAGYSVETVLLHVLEAVFLLLAVILCWNVLDFIGGGTAKLLIVAMLWYGPHKWALLIAATVVIVAVSRSIWQHLDSVYAVRRRCHRSLGARHLHGHQFRFSAIGNDRAKKCIASRSTVLSISSWPRRRPPKQLSTRSQRENKNTICFSLCHRV